MDKGDAQMITTTCTLPISCAYIGKHDQKALNILAVSNIPKYDGTFNRHVSIKLFIKTSAPLCTTLEWHIINFLIDTGIMLKRLPKKADSFTYEVSEDPRIEVTLTDTQ